MQHAPTNSSQNDGPSAAPCVSQQNRETVVAVLDSVQTADGEVLYEPNNNASVHSCRPYGLFPHKENRELMTKFVPELDKDKAAVEATEMLIPVPNWEAVPVENTVDLKLLDGKAQKEVSGLRRAY